MMKGSIRNILNSNLLTVATAVTLVSCIPANAEVIDMVQDYSEVVKSSSGAAINNTTDVNSIIGNFMNNSAKGAGSYYTTNDGGGKYFSIYGGAINNSANVYSISGIFKGNSAVSTVKYTASNNNYSGSSSGYYSGSAGGYVSGSAGGYVSGSAGGYVSGSAGGYVSGSAGGYVSGSAGGYVSGSAGGYVSGSAGGYVSGSAGGYVSSSVNQFYINSCGDANGGAISNQKTGFIEEINGVFEGNYTSASPERNRTDWDSKYGTAYGGAIYNAGKINNIEGDFYNNYVTGGQYNSKSGGAIYNGNYVGNITGNFVENNAEEGGAIRNTGDIDNIDATFVGNTAENSGGAIDNSGGMIDSLQGDFFNNTAESGGAICNVLGVINNIDGTFTNNQAESGGAITNALGEINSIEGTFVNNEAVMGGAIAHASIEGYGKLDRVSADFVNNTATTGGAIYNVGNGTEIYNSNFVDNNAFSETRENIAQGGAIYSEGELSIVADNAESVFKDNRVFYLEDIMNADGIEEVLLEIQNAGCESNSEVFAIESMKNLINQVSDKNAIYANGGKLSLITRNNGHIIMHDNIDGKDYTVSITGDNTGTLSLFNDIRNANVEMGNFTLNTSNGLVHNYNFNNFTLTGDTNFIADVDLANSTMDRISANEYGSHNGNLNLVGLNLLSDSKGKTTEILFADKGLKDNVINGLAGQELTGYSPIYKYTVNYNNREDGGYYVFNRTGGSSYNNYNPAVLSSSVANQSVASTIVNESVKQAFQHADTFSQLPYLARLDAIHSNKYAMLESPNRYSPGLDILNKSTWVKPFTSFERINLSNGPDVDAITYGTLFGMNSDFKPFGENWYRVRSIHGGYTGSSMSYSGMDTTLNGGVLGLTESFYRGDLFTAFTLSLGANVGTTQTPYGSEDFTQLVTGFGNKTGYNFEFKSGRYILQPSLFTSYSLVHTNDYTNAAGVNIESSPLHTITLNPTVKFIANFQNGWQPYASVGLVANVLNNSKVKANDTLLPKMTVDPYVEYGVGIKRLWKDKFTGFLQAMIRNGGRSGVALSFGFKWSLGKDNQEL